MASLGELFISLGFDVDDAKLKNFKSNLRDAHEEMVKLGTVAGTALTALSLFVQKSADGAVRLNNMASMWGANTQAAQTFANALHQVNSQISVSAGQEKYRAFAEMINAKVPVGSGAYGALSLLGVTNPWGSSEEVFSELRKNLPSRMSSLGSTPEKQRARASSLLAELGLGDSLNAILEPDSQYYGAGKYNTTPESLAVLGDYAKSTAEFSEAINRFDNTVAAHLAPAMTKFFNAVTDILNRLPSADHVGDVLLNESEDIKKQGWLGRLGEAVTHDWDLLTGKAVLSSGGAPVAAPSAPFNKAQVAGIMRALTDESGLNPGAVGDHGLAYGIAQWHPDRQANFRKWAGHDIRGSSREEQLAFVNYELTQGLERSAGEKIMRAQNEQEAYLLTKKYYERPAGAGNITINVHSNATDNKEVADLVAHRFQHIINGAYAQTNLGAQQ